MRNIIGGIKALFRRALKLKVNQIKKFFMQNFSKRGNSTFHILASVSPPKQKVFFRSLDQKSLPPHHRTTFHSTEVPSKQSPPTPRALNQLNISQVKRPSTEQVPIHPFPPGTFPRGTAKCGGTKNSVKHGMNHSFLSTDLT